MTQGRPAAKTWRSGAPKLWRIRGTAPDGVLVTLGCYETELDAQSDLKQLAKEGRYRDLELQPIPPKPPEDSPLPAEP